MKRDKIFLIVTLPLIWITIAMYANFDSANSAVLPIKFESCVIVGRTQAIIKVWEEKSDNTRGKVLIKERWVQKDERIPIKSERGRIIYDYKYRSQDNWSTDVHAWCHRGDDKIIP